ncbi:MAG: cell division protein FtsQ/DivIB [Pseudomonadota bacterium]
MPKAESGRATQVIGLLRAHLRTLSGLLLLGMLALATLMGVRWFTDPYRFPLGVVEVNGDFRYLQKAQLQAAVAPLATGGFFTVDVVAIRAAAEALPWVHKASVQRIWPETVRVQIEEQLPVAHWHGQGFLNRFGEAFFPQDTQPDIELPWLDGPDGQEQKVLEQYRQASATLAALGLQLQRLQVDGRRAWELQLTGGITLKLGRMQPWQRLERFVHAWPSVFAGRVAELQTVDLRYSNGFSVVWDQAAAAGDSGNKG